MARGIGVETEQSRCDRGSGKNDDDRESRLHRYHLVETPAKTPEHAQAPVASRPAFAREQRWPEDDQIELPEHPADVSSHMFAEASAPEHLGDLRLGLSPDSRPVRRLLGRCLSHVPAENLEPQGMAVATPEDSVDLRGRECDARPWRRH